MFTIASARKLLEDAQVFFGRFEEDDDPKWDQTINLNDAMYWGCADGEYVADEELVRVAELFWNYGWCGILYWVAVEKRGGETPEFLDVKRMIEFVKREEELKKQEPNPSKRAYAKYSYTLGE
jgi:hypothetical protein